MNWPNPVKVSLFVKQTIASNLKRGILSKNLVSKKGFEIKNTEIKLPAVNQLPNKPQRAVHFQASNCNVLHLFREGRATQLRSRFEKNWNRR